jgi:hypothetical protein
MPIAFYYQRATFAWQTNRVESVDLNSFFPKQPFSKLYVALGFLQHNFTLFGLELLRPNFISAGVITAPNAAAEQKLEAELDPSQLAHLTVDSTSIIFDTGTKLGGMGALGVNRQAEAHAVIGGLPAPRTADVLLNRYGTNWLITSIDVLS